ncbi:MAG: diguanylate cyclase [Desulfobacteraceae bacterium]|nr:MAG: diguanylate cyclase [Desulfobacteraceae bacterium]
MKIAFPIQEDQGVDSRIFNHFGSASLFIIVDTENGKIESSVNPDIDHQHGQCQPLKALGGNKVDAVAVCGIGKGALVKLQNSGVKVFRAAEGSVNENLDLIRSGLLNEFEPEHTCAGHGTGHGIMGECVH